MDKKSIRLPIAAIVLTFNEEQNLDACLSSVASWVDELYVLDSGSRDGTLAVAARYGAHIFYHPFEAHTQQWMWALEHLPLTNDWVLGLDADQRIPAELRDELAALFSSGDDALREVNGFFIKRRQIWRGRWIKHGTYYPKYLLKLFRKQCVHLNAQDLMDHHFYVTGGTRNLQHDLIEENRKENDITFWSEKHLRYARLLAQEEFLKRNSAQQGIVTATFWGNPDQRVLWLKQRWYSLPLYVRPFLYFIYRYVFRLGILDGKQGFVFHFLHAFWFRLLVDIHLDDLTHGRN
ncbi:MAG TPA: glycosyltransferase family 2 protein [Anaerolineae bacterium]|nr:glycosyltransferase family 2 protein [Anaerolineae bacterium]